MSSFTKTPFVLHLGDAKPAAIGILRSIKAKKNVFDGDGNLTEYGMNCLAEHFIGSSFIGVDDLRVNDLKIFCETYTKVKYIRSVAVAIYYLLRPHMKEAGGKVEPHFQRNILYISRGLSNWKEGLDPASKTVRK